MSKLTENNGPDNFKERFDLESNEDLGWNSPPDFIFDDAIASVNSNAKNRNTQTKVFYLLLPISALVLLVYSIYTSTNTAQSIDAQNKKVEALENDMASLREAINSKTLTTPVTDSGLSSTHTPAANTSKAVQTAETSQEEIVSSVAEEVVSKGATVQPSKTKTNLATQKTSSISSVNENSNRSAVITDGNDKVVKTLVEPIAESVINSVSILGDLPTVASLSLSPLHETAVDPAYSFDDRLSFTELHTQEEEAVNRKHRLSFNLMSDYSSLNMTTLSSTTNLPQNNGKFYSGYGSSISYAVPVGKRLSFVNSASYNKIRNLSEMTNTMVYDKGNEVPSGPNSARYVVDTELDTPMGTVKETMEFSVDPTLVNDGDLIEHNTTLSQRLSILNLSSGLELDVVDIGPLKLRTSLQLGLNYVSDLNNQMDSKYKMQNRIMGENNTHTYNAQDMNKFFGSASLGAALSYDVCEDYSLNFGLNYQRSITSLRSKVNGETHLINWFSSVGISRSF